MEARVCRETSVFLLSHIKMMPHSTSCCTHYSCLTLGAQIISRCHKKVVNLYISARNRCLNQKHTVSALQGHFHMSTSHSKQHPICSFTAQGFKTGIRRIGSALNPWGWCCLSLLPSPHFPFNKVMLRKQKIGNKMKPLSTSQCIHLALHKTPPRSSIAFFVQKQANHSRQAVMYYVFTDTFAYLIGAISWLRFRQLRECPEALALLPNPQI